MGASVGEVGEVGWVRAGCRHSASLETGMPATRVSWGLSEADGKRLGMNGAGIHTSSALPAWPTQSMAALEDPPPPLWAPASPVDVVAGEAGDELKASVAGGAVGGRPGADKDLQVGGVATQERGSKMKNTSQRG